MTLSLIDRVLGWLGRSPREAGPEPLGWMEFAPNLSFDPPPDGLLPLVERVVNALGDLTAASAEDVELIVHEALWQIAHQVRQGHVVVIPELGVLSRAESEIRFSPEPGLMEDAHG